MVTIQQLQEQYQREGLSDNVIASFRDFIWQFYKLNARSFPWRDSVSEYGVFVSELMLQQTQAPRVIEKYLSFIQRFPTFASLAKASLKEVMAEWQGLGYNRRAKHVKEAADIIIKAYEGNLPRGVDELDLLPGVGYATACSISAFAFNKEVVFIETNIRSVFLHVFFPTKEEVSDAELLPLVEATLERGRAREWYSALMDYGSFLKKQGNPSKASKHYAKQSVFKGSTRQLRGRILKMLLTRAFSLPELTQQLEDERVGVVIESLLRDQLIVKKGELFSVS